MDGECQGDQCGWQTFKHDENDNDSNIYISLLLDYFFNLKFQAFENLLSLKTYQVLYPLNNHGLKPNLSYFWNALSAEKNDVHGWYNLIF